MVLNGYNRIHRINMQDLDLGVLSLLVILLYITLSTLLKMKEQDLHLEFEYE